MKKSRKVSVLLSFVLMFSLTCVAGAANIQQEKQVEPRALGGYWTTDTITVPGNNGDGFSTKSNTKSTSVMTASFMATARTRDADARLVNSNHESRSAWVRDLQKDTLLHAAENNCEMNHYYWCQISSDLLQFGDATYTIKFSADNIS